MPCVRPKGPTNHSGCVVSITSSLRPVRRARTEGRLPACGPRWAPLLPSPAGATHSGLDPAHTRRVSDVTPPLTCTPTQTSAHVGGAMPFPPAASNITLFAALHGLFDNLAALDSNQSVQLSNRRLTHATLLKLLLRPVGTVLLAFVVPPCLTS